MKKSTADLVLAYVIANPGSSTREIADALGKYDHIASGNLARLQTRGLVRHAQGSIGHRKLWESTCESRPERAAPVATKSTRDWTASLFDLRK